MATTQGIRAGRAFVELFADDTKLVRGLRQAEHKLKAFGSGVRNLGLKTAAVGSAMLAPLAASAKTFGRYGDGIAKMARRTGLSVEALSELQYAAGQSGVEVSDLETGIRRMQGTVYDAGRGLHAAKEALADLGLTFAQIGGLTPEQQFKLLAERISQIEDPTRKAALAMEIFGRSGTRLLPMFASGARGIELLQEQARRLGLTMGAKDALAAEVFGDTIDRLWKVVRMAAFNIGAALAPTLQDLASRIMHVAMAISAWIKENRGFIVSALKVAATISVIGIGLIVLGTIISGVGKIIFGLGVVFNLITTVVAAVISTVTTVISTLSSLGPAIMTFFTSPVYIAIAAIVALGAVLFYVSGAGAKALKWLGDKFHTLKEDVLASFGGISDALAAGDISLAAKILWLMLKMEWTRGVNFLEKAWLNFRNFFIKIGYDAWSGLLAIGETVWHALEVGWMETVGFFSRIWDGFTGFFAKTWENIKAGAQKAWNWIKSLFDDSVDLQTENKMVEAQRQSAISRITDEQQRRAAEREAKTQDERQRARELHDTTLAVIGRKMLDRHAQLDAEYAEQMAENEADLAKARQEWREAIALAKQKRQDRKAIGEADDRTRKARDALANLGDIGDIIHAEAAKIGVRGTFNAAAIRGLIAGDAADRTARATEETAKNTKRLVQAASLGGLTFE